MQTTFALSVLLDLLETIAQLYVPILVMEQSVLNVTVRSHRVIISKDAKTSHQLLLVMKVLKY